MASRDGYLTYNSLGIYLIWILMYNAQYVNSECSKVTVGNTMWQSVREGSYSKTDHSCTGKNVYKQNGGSNYMYYIEASGGWKGWMVGTVQCINSGGMAAQDQADYPQDVQSTWEEVYGGSWYYSQDLTVECYRLSGAAIAGIVVGCLIAVGIIITIIVCCCCCKKNKNTNTVQVARTSNISHTNASVRYNGQRAFVQPGPPGYYTGPPAYGSPMANGSPMAHGSPMVHGYGPPPAYTNYPPNTEHAQTSTAPYPPNRAPSVPPIYTLQDPNSQPDTDGHPTKVTS